MRAPALLLPALLLAAEGLNWQENLRPKLFCSMGSRDYTAFAGNLSAEDHFTRLLYTDFTADFEGGGPERPTVASVNTPLATTPRATAGGSSGGGGGDGGILLIGARNILYKLSASELRLTQTLHWPADDTARDTCVVKGKSRDLCQNFIVVMQQYSSDPTRFLFCGTNAFTPVCRDYADERASFVQHGHDQNGLGLAPFDPRHNSTAVLVGDDLYAGTVADFVGVDSIIFRTPLRTQQFDSVQLNSPDFVGSFAHEDFVYFFFREGAVENINCGKSIFSRVARVCKNDEGGPHKAKHSWTSFLKTRLNCSVPGDFPFYFDEIQAVTGLVSGRYGSTSERIVYATFTTPVNSIGGSAVCAFRLRDMSDAFAGRFKEQRSMSANWLRVEPHKVPSPRPGTCINDTKSLSDQNLNFIKTHSLMDDPVSPFFGAPFVIRTGLVSRFTTLAVDPQVRTTAGDAFDVVFVGTTNGRVIKVINAQSATSQSEVTTVVIEELQVFSTDTVVKDLKVMGSGKEGRRSLAQLAALSTAEVRAFPVQRCDRATTCQKCVALQDPYCAWEIRSSRCSSGDWTKNMASSFLQSIPTGLHNGCPGGSGNLEIETEVESQSYSYLHQFGGYKLGQVVNIVDERLLEKDQKERGGGGAFADGGPGVKVVESGEPQFTLEMLLITVSAGAVAALVLGFVTGYCCGRKCRKDDLGGEQLVGGRRRPLPLQDAEYEYFEQRGGLARPMLHAAPGDGSMFVAGGGGPGLGGVGVPLLHTNKLGAPLPEEVTYAEPDLVTSQGGGGGGGLRQIPTANLSQGMAGMGPPPPFPPCGAPRGNLRPNNSDLGSSDVGAVGGGTHYSSSLLNPANKFNTIGGNKRPLPSINHYESAAEAKLGSGKDPAFYARGRDNFNSYHLSTLGRSSSMRAKEPLLGERAAAGSNSSNDSSSGVGGSGGGGERKGQQVVDSAYGTTTRSVKKVYL